MALIPEYPFQRTRLASVPVISDGTPSALAAVGNSFDRATAIGTSALVRDEAEKRADQRSQDAQSFARKQANLDAEEVANARQAGQNEGVIRTPDAATATATTSSMAERVVVRCLVVRARIRSRLALLPPERSRMESTPQVNSLPVSVSRAAGR